MIKKISIKIFMCGAILLSLFGGSIRQGQAGSGSDPTPQAPISSPSSENTLYLPLVGKSYPPPPPVYGVEMFNFSPWKLDKATQANVNWVRNATFSWAEIEPTPPNPPNHTYNWDSVNNAGLIAAAKNNLTIVATITETPAWARMPKYSNYRCGPIDSGSLDEYSQFIRDLVKIYSAPPYNIHYYEFGNEPDVDPSNFGTWYNPSFGCWGDKNDIYYGGRYYAEMLKWVYPAVKAANSQSQVVIGGLLLNCDPRHPPPTPPGETCLPANFLEGILRNQGAANFDILAFHGYPYYGDGKIVDENHPSFASSGGQLVGKVDFLRYVMAKFDVNKPILMTEIALICPSQNTAECGTPPGNNYLQIQADYVVQTYVRSWGLNLLGTVWYTLEDSNWQQTGMFTGSLKRPAYDALVFMTNELKDATIGSQITKYSGLRGYEFTSATKRIWVLWSPDGVTGITISTPPGVNKIYDKYGNPTTTIPSSIIITHPAYLEFLR